MRSKAAALLHLRAQLRDGVPSPAPFDAPQEFDPLGLRVLLHALFVGKIEDRDRRRLRRADRAV